MFELPESLTFVTGLAVLGVGVAAGFLNVTAGGGSLLAMPMLIFLVRIAVLAQNIAAVLRYHRAGRLDLTLARALVLPTVIGATVGSVVGSIIPDEGFRAVLGWVMLGAAVLVIVGPARIMRDRTSPPSTLIETRQSAVG